MFDPSGVLAAHGPVLIIEDEPFVGEELRAAFRMCGAATLGPFPDAETAKRSTDLRRARLAVINIASEQESAFRFAATLMRDGTPTVLTAGADIEIPPELTGAKVVTKPFEAQAFAKWLLRGEASISRPSGFANKLLNRFPADQLSELRQHASLVQLRRGMALGRAGVRSEHIWFIESGLCILSLRCGGVDIGMIGREGAIGLESCLVSNNALCAPMHCVVEAPGTAVRISAIEMRLMAQSGSTREVLVAYLHSLHAQTASTLESATSLCIRARVSRWLLMASDRIGPAIPVTHDSLAAYLGVRRAGVTEALQDIGAANVIERKRGSIRIRDRDALEARVRGVDAAPRPYVESPAPTG